MTDRACWHEAGHCVVGYLVGQRIATAVVRADGSGEVVPRAPIQATALSAPPVDGYLSLLTEKAGAKSAARWAAECDQEIARSLAGVAAERVQFGGASRWTTGCHDLADALVTAEIMYGRKAASAVVDRVAEDTERMLRTEWTALCRVAQLLEAWRDREVPGELIHAAIEGARMW